MFRSIILTVVAALVVMTYASVGEAQYARLFRGLNLTEEDLAMLRDAANQAYELGEPGSAVDWSNEASGNQGTARLVQRYERDGLPCRKVEHRIRTTARADPQQVVIDVCRDTDGIWKFV